MGDASAVEESWRTTDWAAKRREGRGMREIRGANGTLNGLGGSKHREGEEINDKLATDNPSSLLPPYVSRFCWIFGFPIPSVPGGTMGIIT